MENYFNKYNSNSIQNKDYDELNKLLKELDQYDKLLLEHEKEKERLTKEKERLMRVEIPAFFDKLGIQKIDMNDGKKISIKNVLYTNLAKDKINKFYSDIVALYGEEYKSLFKNKISIDDPPNAIKQLFIDKRIPYDEIKEIHWKTLNSFCKKLLEQGKNIPESVTVFKYREIDVKE